MESVIDLLDKNPFSVYSIYNRVINKDKDKDKDKDNKKDVVEGFGAEAAGSLFGCLMCIVFLYAQYIIVKCYCGNYFKVFFLSIFMVCCCPCIIPYLYYNHLVNGCGRGRIGLPAIDGKK